jgi:hypothetical protein
MYGNCRRTGSGLESGAGVAPGRIFFFTRMTAPGRLRAKNVIRKSRFSLVSRVIR